ncbi:hypothetical protein JG687_00004247 [Phytophthora cactorum]|uniref:Uncharacterized protein n=1 Tax=Phytophthora cactorum TaxID=29920 RepID=A0A329RVL5_9STRA|nr:hypothetical protein Pcac1_g7658 [Phytophthora cactorum]KAG2805573.1 hypothetical protein PC112_g18214 [Phytophthora cactorum]KAG2806960.1 hypothetical protein PC111_g17146 [Phytophthora cactorum]KAG2845589.1 hypothetical protein PC113_g18152 [Phytophthora cactorum]KAG2885279.1 hypothetical protein PC114_g19758 [Phytophthora cactorum]
MQSMPTTRKQFTLNSPPQLSTFMDELNDYEDDDEGYEGVDGDALDQFEDDEDPEDDSSVLAEQLGNYLGVSSSTSQSSDVEDEKLLDLLQQRLFITPEDHMQVDEEEINEPPERESVPVHHKFSTKPSLEEFLADRSSKKLDQDAQRALLETFSQQHGKAAPLSPHKVAQMTARFRVFEEKKARRLTARRRDTETQENIEYRFAPTMNSKSRQLTSQFPTFAERQARLLAKKRLQRAKLEQQREEELSRDRAIDLQESVKTPCICSHGNTSRSETCDLSPSKVAQTGTSRVDGVRHTQACLRFMAMCSKMNASFAIQRKKEMMRRSLDDFITYQEEKKQRQQVRAAIEKAKEAKETTFTPRINAKSEKIYAALIRSGKLDSELSGRMVKPRKTPPLPPKLTFTPIISKKSKWLLKKKQRKLLTNELQDKTDVPRPPSPLPLDVFSRLQQLSHHRDNEAQRQQKMREEEALRSKPPVEWNVIPYAANCSFILQGFDRPNALA